MMSPLQYSSIIALEDNSTEMYMECTEVLIRIARNILQEPQNPKYRSISLGSNVVTNKLLPASGAMLCLFEMGFQEASDKLILPIGSSLGCVKYIHDELIRRRELRKHRKIENLDRPKSEPNPVLISVAKEVTDYIKSLNNGFFYSFIDNILRVWRCESISLHLKALKHVPLCDLKKAVEKNIRGIQKAVKKKEIEDQAIDYQELLLLELCKWFKFSFFQWVNAPECKKCHNKETNFLEISTEEGKHSTEIYKCSTCNETVLFPRYNDAEKLLETHCGRCGEWAHCFYLICRSLGWDVRYILDDTDHVWVEVYSHTKKKWIHCDPCENLIDAPLIYESGWKKKLSYIIAYSKDEIQDVTWRYSCNFTKILQNRKKCSEQQLVDVICNIRRILLNYATEKRREFVTKRAALELVDLLTQRTATEAEKHGRSSGSLAWRLARGEISVDYEFKPFIWKLDKEKDNMEFKLSYCTASDEYFLGSAKKIIKGWRSGLYKVDSIFRKVENDWKMTYLARQEGTNKGALVWRFEAEGNFSIGDIKLKICRQKFDKGEIICKLCNDERDINIPEGISFFSTSDFKGSKFLELSVELSGGTGDHAWQHAQILRQSLSDYEKTLELLINLIEV